MFSSCIVERELDAAECLIVISESFNDAVEFSGLVSDWVQVESNKRNFEFSI